MTVAEFDQPIPITLAAMEIYCYLGWKMRLGRMRYLRIFATGLLGAGALFGLFLAVCILPKITQAESDLHTTLPGGWISTTAAITGYWMLDLIYFLAALFLAAFIVALLPFVAESVRRVACGIIYALAFGASACAMYLLTVAAAGMIYVNGDLADKNRIYASVLDQFSLLESANGKFDQVQAFIAKMSSVRMIEFHAAASLSDEQRKEQIRGLVYGMKASKDVAFLKQVLATSDEFRTDIVKNPFDAKPVLEAAALCGAPADNIDAFYTWLEPKIGTDGWTTLPLHLMVFDK